MTKTVAKVITVIDGLYATIPLQTISYLPVNVTNLECWTELSVVYR